MTKANALEKIRELEKQVQSFKDKDAKEAKAITKIFTDAVDGHRKSHLAIFGNLDNYTPLFGIEADAPTDVDVGAMDVKQDAAESKEPSKGT